MRSGALKDRLTERRTILARHHGSAFHSALPPIAGRARCERERLPRKPCFGLRPLARSMVRLTSATPSADLDHVFDHAPAEATNLGGVLGEDRVVEGVLGRHRAAPGFDTRRPFSRACCHSRLARTVTPKRRGDSIVTVGASGPLRIRRPVRSLIRLRAHHSWKVRTWSSARLVSGASSASTRLRMGVFCPRFCLGCFTSGPHDDRASRKKEKARPARNAPWTDLESPDLGLGDSRSL